MSEGSEDELVARAIARTVIESNDSDFSAAWVDENWTEYLEDARVARPILAQQEREKVLREMLNWGDAFEWPNSVFPELVERFATEHGITLEEK